MRVMLKATLDTEKASEVIRSGRMPELMKRGMERLKPEAAYFGPEGGRRTAFLVFDMKDSTELVPDSEVFFNELGATVEVFPLMNVDDLQKGLAQIS
ncbi:hypothetical protein IM697_43515 [Streptomyces ferrugineus]|uniref:DUF3303 domain-containing protein n=1 Tax=Streptomyces ferrugineus TaxID=1413221 RepID=A0A7M2SKG3_9ACTN|nr:hypothetical protein [Streptomyces ferrugineus]QOV36754.1 hypothetical protein IM697_43515 [Streptomyces ferrugineus]